MAETKTKVALERQGWKIGERAFSASVTYGDEWEPTRESHVLGLFRSQAQAKVAVEAEIVRRVATETRDGWWGGDVEEGTVMDESFHDREYGRVEDWTFEPDDRKDRIWMHAGLAWNE